MIAKIVYIVGVVLAVLGCIDILKSKKITIIPKIIFVILLLATSWIGVAVHYLYGKSKL